MRSKNDKKIKLSNISDAYSAANMVKFNISNDTFAMETMCYLAM